MLAACLVTLAAPAAGHPLVAQQAVHPSDSLLLDMAAAIVRGGPAANRLWHTPWYTDRFAILSPDGRAVVVLPDLPPPELGIPLAERVLGDAFPTPYLFAPGSGIPPGHGRKMLGDQPVLAWPQHDSIFGLTDPLLATVMVMYHEIFHQYQFGARWVIHGTTEPPGEILVSRKFQQFAADERTLLSEALDTADTDSLRTLLRSYLEVRKRRMSLLPPEARGTESTHESVEGTANFVAYQAALLAVQGSDTELVTLLRYDLAHTPPFDDPGYELGAYRQWHVYATGAALAFIVDRLTPGRTWQTALENGATYQQLIEAVIR